MMDDKPVLYSLVSSAVIFGVGFASGILFRKIFNSSGNGGKVDNFSRALRVASIRASGIGPINKMVFVVRMDLGMGKGKIAAQCSHAATMCYRKALVMDEENLNIWEARGATKICLKADGDDTSLIALQKKAKELKLVTAIVRDAGHTQVKPSTITVMGIGPAPLSVIDQVTGHLKLL